MRGFFGVCGMVVGAAMLVAGLWLSVHLSHIEHPDLPQRTIYATYPWRVIVYVGLMLGGVCVFVWGKTVVREEQLSTRRNR